MACAEGPSILLRRLLEMSDVLHLGHELQGDEGHYADDDGDFEFVQGHRHAHGAGTPQSCSGSGSGYLSAVLENGTAADKAHARDQALNHACFGLRGLQYRYAGNGVGAGGNGHQREGAQARSAFASLALPGNGQCQHVGGEQCHEMADSQFEIQIDPGRIHSVLCNKCTATLSHNNDGGAQGSALTAARYKPHAKTVEPELAWFKHVLELPTAVSRVIRHGCVVI